MKQNKGEDSLLSLGGRRQDLICDFWTESALSTDVSDEQVYGR